jgi:hypothetical protein
MAPEKVRIDLESEVSIKGTVCDVLVTCLITRQTIFGPPVNL